MKTRSNAVELRAIGLPVADCMCPIPAFIEFMERFGNNPNLHLHASDDGCILHIVTDEARGEGSAFDLGALYAQLKGMQEALERTERNAN